MRAAVMIASVVDWERAPRLRASDQAAIHLARTWSQSVRVIAPDGDAWARAYAADDAIFTSANAASLSDSAIVLVGSGAVEAFGEATVARAAELLGAELVFGALRVVRDTTSNATIVECAAGRGARDRFSIRGPLVVVLDDAVAPAPYVSRRRLRGAGLPTHGQLPRPADDHDWRPAIPRPPRAPVTSQAAIVAETRANAVFGIHDTSSAKTQTHVVRAEPRECANILVRWLAHQGFLDLAKLPAIPADSTPEAASANSGGDAVAASVSLSPASPQGPVAIEQSLSRGPRSFDRDDSMRIARRPRRRDPAVVVARSGPLARRPRRVDGSDGSQRRVPVPLRATPA